MVKFAPTNLKKNIPLSAIVLLILFLISLLVFVYIGCITINGNENQFDLNIIAWQTVHPTPLLIKVMKLMTFFGSNDFLLPTYIVIIVFFVLKKQYRYAIAVLLVSLGAKLTSTLLKSLFQRSRPEISLIEKPLDYSYPSGHAHLSFVFCGILAWFAWHSHLSSLWKWVISVFLLLFTLSIGASRIVLNVHFATDVIGGFALGMAWIILSFVVLRKWLRPLPSQKISNS